MKFTILDHKIEKNSEVYLCKMALSEYIVGLKQDYNDYEIQRGIVKNVYLDRLIETVLNFDHIPIITLVTDEKISIEMQNNNVVIGTIHNFDILDGLQRTYRLKSLFDIVTLCKDEIGNLNIDNKLSKYELSKRYSKDVKALNSSISSLLRLIEFIQTNSIDELFTRFTNNFQWFEIWTNLSSEERVNKMLTLNAGHKPVTLKHQLELLFINMLSKIKETNPDIRILRDKDKTSKNRDKYSFEFSNLISASIAFHKGKTIVFNQEMILALMEDNSDFSKSLSWEYIESFIYFLQNLDDIMYTSYGDIGTQWLGRETILNGLFAALGEYASQNSLNSDEIFDLFLKRIGMYPKSLNISEFEKMRNSLDLSRVNIGNILRKITYNGIYEYINNSYTNKVVWASPEKSEVNF